MARPGYPNLVQPSRVQNDRTTLTHDRFDRLNRKEHGLHVGIHEPVILCLVARRQGRYIGDTRVCGLAIVFLFMVTRLDGSTQSS